MSEISCPQAPLSPSDVGCASAGDPCYMAYVGRIGDCDDDLFKDIITCEQYRKCWALATAIAESCCTQSFKSIVKDELIEQYDRMRSRFRMN